LKTVLLLTVALCIVGCAPAARPVVPIVEHFDSPPLNKIASAELGETILDKGTKITQDAIILDAPLSVGNELLWKKFTIPPEVLLARDESNRERFYYAQSVTVAVFPDSHLEDGGIKVSLDGKKWAVFRGANVEAMSFDPPASCHRKSLAMTDRPSFRQELVYDGRVGPSVKFLYREVQNDFARPAFTQEVQYDLSESNVIGFKGARIKIIQATNTLIQYQVLASFPNQE
jgi:hypothetical protein